MIATTPKDSDTLAVSVQDNGPGILPDDKPYIFDRFYKADKAHTFGNGTGLGLAISRMIIERHKQSLVLEDTQSGARFVFTLRRSTDSQAEGA